MKGRQESAEMVGARRDGRLPLWEERRCRPAVVNWRGLRTGQGQLQRQCHLHHHQSLQAPQHRISLWEERGCRAAVVERRGLRTGQGPLQRQCHLHHHHSLQALQHRMSQMGALMKGRPR